MSMRRSRQNGQLRRTSSMRRRSTSATSISSLSCEACAITCPNGSAINDPPQNSRPLPCCASIAANVAGLEADAVRHRHVHTVGNRMRALNGTPRIVLCLAVLRFLVRMPADRRGIEQHVRSLQRRQARALGIPLVPAHQRAELSEVRLERFETEIARREVKLLVVQRIIGDVHLAIDSREFAALVDDGCRVVINPARVARTAMR